MLTRADSSRLRSWVSVPAPARWMVEHLHNTNVHWGKLWKEAELKAFWARVGSVREAWHLAILEELETRGDYPVRVSSVSMVIRLLTTTLDNSEGRGARRTSPDAEYDCPVFSEHYQPFCAWCPGGYGMVT
jgi:hypothetical protein